MISNIQLQDEIWTLKDYQYNLIYSFVPYSIAGKPVQLGPSAALCSDPVKLDQDYHEQTRSQ